MLVFLRPVVSKGIFCSTPRVGCRNSLFSYRGTKGRASDWQSYPKRARNLSTMTSFQAWRVDKSEGGAFVGSEQTLSTDDLPFAQDPDTSLIRVTHSSLNYKDALSASGNKGVTRKFPHTPGIDAAGYKMDTGDAVLVTGYDLGMNSAGGFGEIVRVPNTWIVPMPTESWRKDPSRSMIYGTAGLTAALLVDKLLVAGQAKPGQSVVVTGATGAVGSVAVELLARLGFEVTAVTGKSESEFLRVLGASKVVGRETLASTVKPLLRPVFDHAIDTVGGSPLEELLKQIKPGGSVACCGLAAGPALDTTVLPFILRGINLLGVDSVEIPLSRKTAMWEKLASEWACPVTESKARRIGRHELDHCLKAFLKGESAGKIVLDHSLTDPGPKRESGSAL